MILDSMELKDFGVYEGSHKLYMTPRDGRTVVLIGGVNGAGKTTLFKSIRLCLYGRASMGAGTALKRYHNTMMKLLHMDLSSGRRADEAYVSLKFQYGDGSDLKHYAITRSWYNNNGRIDERLRVGCAESQDAVFEDIQVEDSELQAFIDNMLPQGITDMFFFDGEEIATLAESGDEDRRIKSSLDTLLGLDIISRLHEDIGLYVLRNSAGTDAIQELDSMRKELAEIERNLGRLMEKRVYHEAEVGRLRKELAIREDEFNKRGGRHAEKRQDMAEKKNTLEHKLADTAAGIRNICNGVMPLCMLPDNVDLLRSELLKDIRTAKSQTRREVVHDVFKELGGALDSKYLDNEDLRDALKDVRQAMLKSISRGRRIFDFSLEEMNAMLHDMDSSRRGLADMARMADEYKITSDELVKVKSMMDMMPQTDEIGPLFSEISKISREIGEMDGEMHNIEMLVAGEKSLRALKKAEIRKLLARHMREKKTIAGIELAPKVQEVLDMFARRLRDEKINMLESNVLKCIRRLFHKKDFATAISIDQNTFKVTMFRNGTVVNKDTMSTGEQQMYTTAIMWGLAITSGRRLPFMIDTPLARLDDGHRRNLVHGFYPEAAHQTLIFSTDTEIVGEHYEGLYPHLSHSALITYDTERGTARFREGYFEEETCSIGAR